MKILKEKNRVLGVKTYTEVKKVLYAEDGKRFHGYWSPEHYPEKDCAEYEERHKRVFSVPRKIVKDIHDNSDNVFLFYIKNNEEFFDIIRYLREEHYFFNLSTDEEGEEFAGEDWYCFFESRHNEYFHQFYKLSDYKNNIQIFLENIEGKKDMVEVVRCKE